MLGCIGGLAVALVPRHELCVVDVLYYVSALLRLSAILFVCFFLMIFRVSFRFVLFVIYFSLTYYYYLFFFWLFIFYFSFVLVS